MKTSKLFGVVEVKHSPKVFFISIIVFSIIYWLLGPNNFFDNISTKKDIRGINFKINNNTFFDYIYFSIVVQSLLGFGEIIPATRISRFFVSLQVMISLYLLLGTSSAILLTK
jgi:hypothetical protein